MSRILAVKLGALGDVVLAFAALRRIRAAHPEAEITALTTPAYAALLGASPYVDRVDPDGRPEGLTATLAMLRRLRRLRFDRVYDLQTSSRSDAYFQALRPNPPPWSGTAPGCALPHRNPDRDRMHTLERQADQLKDAGVWPDAPTAPGSAPPPDLSWLLDPGAPARFGLHRPYALLVPGGSAHRPEKRWPVERYAELAGRLAIPPVVVGGAAEAPLAAAIRAAAPATHAFCGENPLPVLGALARRAAFAVGNDTGPTHLVAALGCPTLVLFGAHSDPAKHAPQGPAVAVIRVPSLDGLGTGEVLAALSGLVPEELSPAPGRAGQGAESGSTRPSP